MAFLIRGPWRRVSCGGRSPDAAGLERGRRISAAKTRDYTVAGADPAMQVDARSIGTVKSPSPRP
jgi:hypothetical protein